MSKIVLDDFESLRRYYFSTQKMVKEIEVEVLNVRSFSFPKEKMFLYVLSLETGDFLIKMRTENSEDQYIVHKSEDFTEGNRQDVINNGCQWIFKGIDNENGFELDDLEYDDFIENEVVVHSRVFPTLYGNDCELSDEDTAVILNMWSCNEPEEGETYIFALEVGELISLYEGYLVC